MCDSRSNNITIACFLSNRFDDNRDYTIHRLILGTHTSDEQNHLIIAAIRIPKITCSDESMPYDGERGGKFRT